MAFHCEATELNLLSVVVKFLFNLQTVISPFRYVDFLGTKLNDGFRKKANYLCKK
jgi:hypothetical protein